jgi:hypothetical protein
MHARKHRNWPVNLIFRSPARNGKKRPDRYFHQLPRTLFSSYDSVIAHPVSATQPSMADSKAPKKTLEEEWERLLAQAHRMISLLRGRLRGTHQGAIGYYLR